MKASDWARFTCAGAAERVALRTRPPGQSLTDEGVRVGAVLAAWDSERTADVVRRFLVPLRHVPGVQLTAVCVANRELSCDGAPWLPVLSGSNDGAEFSAYDEGARALDLAGDALDVLIFLNDRALSYRHRYHFVASLNFLDFVARHPVLTGAIDSYGRTVDTAFGSLSTWCRTNLFVMSPSLANQVAPFDVAQGLVNPAFVPSEYPGDDWQAEALGAEYGELVMRWLTGQDAWYQATALSPESWGVLRSKLLAILNEQLLSIRCIEAGGTNLPIRMAQMLAQGSRHAGMPDRLFELLRRYPISTDEARLSPSARVLLAVAITSARSSTSSLCERLLRRAESELPA